MHVHSHNPCEYNIKRCTETLQDSNTQVSAAQFDKIKDLNDRIEELDRKVRTDLKAYRQAMRDDYSDAGSQRSIGGVSRVSRRSKMSRAVRKQSKLTMGAVRGDLKTLLSNNFDTQSRTSKVSKASRALKRDKSSRRTNEQNRES